MADDNKKDVAQVVDEARGFVVRAPDPVWGTEADTSLHVVLVNPEIPGNTGSIGRLCAGTNVWLHLVRPLGYELDNRYLKRAGLDYWPHVKLCVHDDFDAVASIFGPTRMSFFTKKASQSYADVTYTAGSVLVFGCETAGLSDELLTAYAEHLVRIPITDKIRSINLANACAVAVYEALRQLDFAPLANS